MPSASFIFDLPINIYSNKTPAPKPRALGHVNDRRKLRQSDDASLMLRFTSLLFANDKPTRAPAGLRARLDTLSFSENCQKKLSK